MHFYWPASFTWSLKLSDLSQTWQWLNISQRGARLWRPLSVFSSGANLLFKITCQRGHITPPKHTHTHITKLNPFQPGNRWALNLVCTTWVGVVGWVVVGGGGCWESQAAVEKSYTTSLSVSSSHPHITPPPFWTAAFSFPYPHAHSEEERRNLTPSDPRLTPATHTHRHSLSSLYSMWLNVEKPYTIRTVAPSWPIYGFMSANWQRWYSYVCHMTSYRGR